MIKKVKDGFWKLQVYGPNCIRIRGRPGPKNKTFYNTCNLYKLRIISTVRYVYITILSLLLLLFNKDKLS